MLKRLNGTSTSGRKAMSKEGKRAEAHQKTEEQKAQNNAYSVSLFSPIKKVAEKPAPKQALEPKKTMYDDGGF
ncbi:MAG: hypothetical protein NTZ67_03025 [Gammaproteobacteria bacterium]|nr:hypothetical protein [Gammaproteobacteria bacterium]